MDIYNIFGLHFPNYYARLFSLACLLTMHADVFLTTSNCTVHMNRRFIVVMCVLGIAVAGAFFMGSPMFGGFDGIR